MMQQQVPLRPTESSLDADLIAAYEATDFLVDGRYPFVLKIGVPSQALAKLYREHDCTCAAYVTACNPLGENVGKVRNTELQRQLALQLAKCNRPFVPGVGQDSKGEWPGEPSYLVPGIPLADSIVLGNALQQNAIVWCDADAVPKLILLR